VLVIIAHRKILLRESDTPEKLLEPDKVAEYRAEFEKSTC